ncbi:transglutaminase family protein [Cohaesibacter sp. CAU 1516]|uniref:transglutaminase family protein n=1 Tax=Cohaesibacter sp. CAU 1516 TaxID=2576038 RepID=UPI0010FE73DF|nr:transglutaminase family protein [Cohaesibacter sp. CAU 1516]TLP44308.1 transglutaminase family protein [Cohaesibacter sp. CAU 1516]
MSIHAALTHRTKYCYDRQTGMGPQVIRLRPAPHTRNQILSYSLKVEPAEHFINWQQDPFGNFLARVIFPEKVESFEVTVDLVTEMAIINPFDFFIEEAAEHYPFAYGKEDKKDLAPYLEKEEPTKLLAALLKEVEPIIKQKDLKTIDLLVQVNYLIESKIDYLIRMEPGVQAPEETLTKGSGSCRDSAWLMVHVMRHLGLAARFTSGYLIQLKPDVKPLDGPAGTDHDFTDLHAWTEVYVPGAGWIGLDPTSGLLTGESHIPLACTPSPISAAPITGAHDKAEVEFEFEMDVQRIYERPRVTKPYTDEQWKAINALGETVDERLEEGDVRLTMGGEPTFISIDDYEADEWNTAAVGPTKRAYAENLIRRLRDRFAPGGLLHFGQGKWYPGEQLPRWAFALYWRADEEPLWEDPALIDSEKPKATADHKVAQRFIYKLSEKLRIDPKCVIPAYEDPAHFALVEQKLPVDVDHKNNKIDDPAERARIVKVFEQGLSNPAGFVLPVQAWNSEVYGRSWMSEVWKLRREKLYILPGDSPVGFRLPLGSLPYLTEVQYPHVLPMDPHAAHAALPAKEALLRDRRKPFKQRDHLKKMDPAKLLEAPDIQWHESLHKTFIPMNEISGSVRTALTIEPRNGHLCIFMPPLNNAEDYAAMVAAIEEAAKEVKQPVHIEGYEPPFDPRLNVIKVTPDPGVIEVNIQPATNWKEASKITQIVYEEARLARLGTEKFMLDGRHTGTGGGNHIVMGGLTPSDSPFLRRPDLLGSLITYWQNHPSLSYLFSGTFIGPTSQAPRVDEGRHENLYELEIALKQLPLPGEGYIPNWQVDRLFRNLLIDVTGNTHRAEICIDKLFSPDGPTGRLGLVEFRSFEMPPHAQMSLAQQLLLRAIIVRLWEQPYRQRLVRFGTQLHDKFMLPHYVRDDFRDVLRDLANHDIKLDEDWFAPHFEFRFPRYGEVNYDGVQIELRQALEPWNVLGEEGAVGGTARYVDSSLERVQVKAKGLNPDRHILTVNQVAVPLHPTGRQDEAVAGVRYRAWQPPSCLHPMIGVHTPLTFDLFDKWNMRSLGGCRYHVAHPGGRGYEIFPVNAYEAESRRLSRFETIGHSAGYVDPVILEDNPDFPYTLDLRLASVR